MPLLVPAVIVVLLVWQQRWRRLALVIAGAAAGVIAFVLVDLYLDLPGTAGGRGEHVDVGHLDALPFTRVRRRGGGSDDGRQAVALSFVSTRERLRPSLALVLIVAIAGTAGVVPLVLAVSVGFVGGAAILVVFGAPNRRPAPAAIVQVLRDAGIDVRTSRCVAPKAAAPSSTTSTSRAAASSS